jgi:asparaginyl-tRNA synthetase
MTEWTIRDILTGKVAVGAAVVVEGWIRTRRDSKAGLSFLQVHDGSCFDPIQVVAESTLPNYQTEILHLTTHCSVRVAGTLIESQGKGQKFEVKAETVTVVGWVENPDSYPVSSKRHTMEHLRTVAHLRARTNTFGAVARVRHCLSMAVHRYFHERGYFWMGQGRCFGSRPSTSPICPATSTAASISVLISSASPPV